MNKELMHEEVGMVSMYMSLEYDVSSFSRNGILFSSRNERIPVA